MKKAIVLGGTIPHVDLILKLKQRGYYTILIDYNDNPPAKEVADKHIQESTLNKEKVLEIAKDHKIDLIITSCIDQANCVACYVGEKLGLPIPYSYETSLDVTKKGRMKEIFWNNNIPTAKYYVLESDDGSSPHIEYPIVIKPSDANSSKGVFKISNDKEFHEKIKESFSYSREGKTIVEKYISGAEIEATCIAVNGKSTILLTRDYEAYSIEGRELQNINCSVPGKQCEKHYTELESICQKIVDAFHLNTTPFFIQAICNDEGVFVLEFAPRIAGGTTYDMVHYYTGFDYLEASIKSFLHEPIEVNVIPNSKKYLTEFLYMKPGVFDRVDGVQELEQNGEIDRFFHYTNSGKVISESFNTGNRVGAVMVSANTEEECSIKMDEVMKKISVKDVNGNDVKLRLKGSISRNE